MFMHIRINAHHYVEHTIGTFVRSSRVAFLTFPSRSIIEINLIVSRNKTSLSLQGISWRIIDYIINYCRYSK